MYVFLNCTTYLHNNMADRVRTRVDKASGERIAYSDMAIRNNSAIIEYCRTSMAALSGATSGKIDMINL